MATKFSPVSYAQDSARYEEELEATIREIPDRPFLLPTDFPSDGTQDGQILGLAEAEWRVSRGEREYQARAATSGYNANPYAGCGARTPAEQYEIREREEEVRAIQCGLPDSSPEMPAKATSSRPFKGLRG